MRIAAFSLLMAATPAWAQPAPAPAVQAAPAGMIMQAVFGLVIVLGILAGAAWLLKRFNPVKSGLPGNVRIVGGVSVGTRERVVVVEVADQWIVVGVAPGSVNALSTMARQEVPVSDDTSSHGNRNFSSWLKHSMEQRNGRS